MPIIDEKKQHGGRIALVMLKETGTIALFNDDEDVVYCFECMFMNHSHEMAKFWSLTAEDIASGDKTYICDECGTEIH